MIKVFGLQRTGTNYLWCLLTDNFSVDAPYLAMDPNFGVHDFDVENIVYPYEKCYVLRRNIDDWVSAILSNPDYKGVRDLKIKHGNLNEAALRNLHVQYESFWDTLSSSKNNVGPKVVRVNFEDISNDPTTFLDNLSYTKLNDKWTIRNKTDTPFA